MKQKVNKRTIDKLEELVKSFADLPDGWDGYDSPTIPIHIIEKTILILNGLTYLPNEIFPTPRMTIQLEYSHYNNELEVEIDERCIYFLEEKRGIEREWVEYDDDCINLVLREFFKKN